MYSAAYEREWETECLQAGARSFLYKPMPIEQWLTAIRHVAQNKV